VTVALCTVLFVTVRNHVPLLVLPRLTAVLVIKHNACPVTISMKVVAQDKQKMVDDFRAARAVPKEPSTLQEAATLTDEEAAKLPALQWKDATTDDWITFDKPVLYLYAGQGPYVGRFVFYLHNIWMYTLKTSYCAVISCSSRFQNRMTASLMSSSKRW
jgi:hypothetical protein